MKETVMRRKSQSTLSELLAKYAVSVNAISATIVVESFVELLIEAVVAKFPTVRLNEEQLETLNYCIIDFIEKEVLDDANSLLDEWAEGTLEEFQERREAYYGQY